MQAVSTGYSCLQRVLRKVTQERASRFSFASVFCAASSDA